MKMLIIVLLVVAIHRWLSTRSYKILGGIFPLAFLCWFILNIFKQSNIDWKDIMLGVLGMVVLLSIWTEGRHSYKKNIDKQITKMKTDDMK